MVAALNKEVLATSEHKCLHSTRAALGEEFHGRPLRELVDFGLRDQNQGVLQSMWGAVFGSSAQQQLRAVATVAALEKELTGWTATPVLRVIDEHNELWAKLGDDTTAWPSLFEPYSKFEILKGVRI
jgi:hypothetical protein